MTATSVPMPNVHRMTFARARAFMVVVGIAILAVIVGVMLFRGIDSVEVIGAVLFVPVFLAFMVAGIPGGAVAGMAAAVTYAVLRIPAMDAVGAGSYRGLIVTRTAAYVAFGLIGGYANREVRSSLRKLDLYDEVDDTTGLQNARSFALDADLEMGRARRYGTIFSVALMEVPRTAFAALGRRRQRIVLRELGQSLRQFIRTVDHPVHAVDGGNHLFAVILPETGSEGADVFGGRLDTWLREFCTSRGVATVDTSVRTASFPDDEADIVTICSMFTDVAASEHSVVDPRTQGD
jgi:GGDEF domain-containing protein